MNLKKTIASFIAAAVMSLSLTCGASAEEGGSLVILYTNDVHCAVTDNLGYASLSALRQQELDKNNAVILADAGDAVQGVAIGALSNGEYIIDIMNDVGYDVAIPGNHEFDYGTEQLMNLAETAEFPYVCSNFIDLRTDKTVFAPYVIKEAGGHKVAFIGIITPDTFTSSAPAYFQDETGEFVYDFCRSGDGQLLYSTVQSSVDNAKSEGADVIIALAHLGTAEAVSSPFLSTSVIANVEGLDAVIDGHSHSVISGEYCKDKSGKDVLLTSTGTKLNNIGRLTVSKDGSITSELVSEFDPETAAESVHTAYDETTQSISAITESFDSMLKTVVAHSDVDLTVNDSATGKRLIRNGETNLGDLCADAYRKMLGTDIAILNGGGIRADISAGDITYGDIIAVHPFGNMGTSVEATGQQILDALELGSMDYPEETGGFLQVSGLTYELHAYLPSSVILDEQGMFSEVGGEYRVKNVKVDGKPLDKSKTYTVACHDYLLKNGGDGFSMFEDCKLLSDGDLVDNEILILYITEELGGAIGNEYADNYGQGRIKLVTSAPASTEIPDTGSKDSLYIVVLFVSLGAAILSMPRKKSI